MESMAIARRSIGEGAQKILVDLSSVTQAPGALANFIGNRLDAIYVFLDFFDRPEGKLLPFISMAKFTLIPRTIAGHPN
jgi:hypothetical protein